MRSSHHEQSTRHIVVAASETTVRHHAWKSRKIDERCIVLDGLDQEVQKMSQRGVERVEFKECVIEYFGVFDIMQTQIPILRNRM